MNDVKAWEIITPASGMIKPATPAEEAREKIHMMQEANNSAERTERLNNRIYRTKQKTAKHVFGYLRWHYNLSSTQILKLNEQGDFNNLPEVILAEKKIKVILLGWFPIFGWGYTINYILFRRRIRFLRAHSENMFYASAHADIKNWLDSPSRYSGDHGP